MKTSDKAGLWIILLIALAIQATGHGCSTTGGDPSQCTGQPGIYGC